MAPRMSQLEKELSVLRATEADNVRLRAALQPMVAEFSDYHYDGCPADTGGKCNCYAGLIVQRAQAALDGQTGER